MLKWLRSPIVWGVLLIVAGLLFLIQAITGFQLGSLFWAALFALGALFFLNFYLGNRMNWWALIPAFTLGGVCLSILSGVFLSGTAESILSQVFVLGGIGASFVVVYTIDRRQWWAIIPAGVMFTIVLVSILDDFLGSDASGGVMLIGIGGTFAVLALLPPTKARMGWAWIPAGVLVVIGTVIAGAASQRLIYFIPVVLILIGLFLIVRTFAFRK